MSHTFRSTTELTTLLGEIIVTCEICTTNMRVVFDIL